MLDTYNGRPAEVESYRQVTGVTAPILRQAANGTDYAGARLEDIVVVDQNREVRYWINASSTDQFVKVNQMVDALVNKSPVIALSLRQLYYGTKLEVGQSKTVTLEVNNTGAGPLEITGYEAPNEITIEPAAFTVGPKEKKTLDITLTPTKMGTFTGSVTLKHGNNSVGVLQVPILELTIEGRQLPSIGLAQQSLDLGKPEVGQTVEQTFTVTNGGPGALTVSDIQSSIPNLTVSDKKFSVAAGKSKDITLTFTPQAEGAVSGVLTILSDDPAKSSLDLTLSGSVVFVPADPRADFDASGKIDFTDFVAFVRAFGTTDATYDIDKNGRVDFGDFLVLAKSFGKSVN